MAAEDRESVLGDVTGPKERESETPEETSPPLKIVGRHAPLLLLCASKDQRRHFLIGPVTEYIKILWWVI